MCPDNISDKNTQIFLVLKLTTLLRFDKISSKVRTGVLKVKLSTKGRYGVKAMFCLATEYGDEPVSIKSISEKQNITVAYLEQLFAPLRKAGLIISIRGAQGGYKLAREPKDITVAQIMDVLEGPIEVSECLEDESKCSNLDCCATRSLWAKIKNSIDNVTQNVTLQDMIDESKKLMEKRSE